MATVTFTFTFVDENLTEFKLGFLKRYPVPKDRNTGEPTMSENDWIKEKGRIFYFTAYNSGKSFIAKETAGELAINDIVI